MTTIAQLQAAGIPVTTAANGGPVETKTVVQNVDQLRSLLDVGLDQQGRQAHFNALFNGIAPATNGQAAASATAFPLTVSVTAAAGPLTVSSKYDLSTTDGSTRVVTFTDVVLEQGGY